MSQRVRWNQKRSTYTLCATMALSSIVFIDCGDSLDTSPAKTEVIDDQVNKIKTQTFNEIHTEGSFSNPRFLKKHRVSLNAEWAQRDIQEEVHQQCTSSSTLQSYQRYVKPLLEEGRDSSCGECHLGGNTLQALVYDTPCQTLYCWEQSGVINFDSPADSLRRHREAVEG